MPIVVNLPPEVEAQLQEKAVREEQDINLIAAEILTKVLASEAQELQKSIKGIQRGLDDFEAGRSRSFKEFAEEKRRQYKRSLKLNLDLSEKPTYSTRLQNQYICACRVRGKRE